MLERFSSGHSPTRGLALLLAFFGHSFAGSLYERVRPVRHLQHPYLHQQRGLDKTRKWHVQIGSRSKGHCVAVACFLGGRARPQNNSQRQRSSRSILKTQTKRPSCGGNPYISSTLETPNYSPNVWRFWMDIRHSNYIRRTKITSDSHWTHVIGRWSQMKNTFSSSSKLWTPANDSPMWREPIIAQWRTAGNLTKLKRTNFVCVCVANKRHREVLLGANQHATTKTEMNRLIKALRENFVYLKMWRSNAAHSMITEETAFLMASSSNQHL